MKRILLIIALMLSLGMRAMAQSYSVSDIIGKVWVAKDGLSFYSEVADLHLSVSASTVTMTFVAKDTGKVLRSLTYDAYVSMDKVSVFDKSQKGNKSGRYLNMYREYVFNGNKMEEMYSAKIISVNDSLLVLQFTDTKEPITFHIGT